MRDLCPALFAGLFDDAALFPPGEAPMAAAVPAHRELRARLGDLVGPFVVPVARLGELTAQLGDGEPLGVSLIAAAGDLPAAAARVHAHAGLTLAAVEVPVVADAAAAAEAVQVLDDVLPAGVPAAVELPRSAALFPSPTELAATLHACVARGIAVKCTAGLHHAVRHTDPATGFEHHGVLNVLLAASALASGAPPAVATQWLAETDPGAVATAVCTWPADRAARARAVFTSFGTCSVLEPVDDLVTLGLLPSPERIPA